MKVQFSKEFAKAMEKLSGKIRNSVVAAINEVINSNCIEEISDCKKIEGLCNVYRIRIGDRRAFFLYYM